jgi:hypothetical protein
LLKFDQVRHLQQPSLVPAAERSSGILRGGRFFLHFLRRRFLPGFGSRRGLPARFFIGPYSSLRFRFAPFEFLFRAELGLLVDFLPHGFVGLAAGFFFGLSTCFFFSLASGLFLSLLASLFFSL